MESWISAVITIYGICMCVYYNYIVVFLIELSYKWSTNNHNEFIRILAPIIIHTTLSFFPNFVIVYSLPLLVKVISICTYKFLLFACGLNSFFFY